MRLSGQSALHVSDGGSDAASKLGTLDFSAASIDIRLDFR
jgi:hypothetical protein